MMTIAYIVTAQTHEGPLNVVKALIREMTKRGNVCRLLYLEDREEIDFGCEKKRIGYWDDINLAAFDVVHTHGIKPMWFVYLYLLRHRRPKHTRFVTTLHSFIGEDFRWKYGRWKGWLLSKCFLHLANCHDVAITLSDVATQYYSRWIPKKKLMRCYHGMDLEAREDNCSEEHQNLVVGTYCALERIKGVDVLIKAMDYLPENTQLMVIGNGSERVRLEAQSEHLGGRVTFMGDQLEPYRFLPTFDVFVVASYSEGFCLALLEAAHYGKEVVCSDIPGMREKFSDEEVTYFETGNAEDLAHKILLAQGAHHGDNLKRKAQFFSEESMGQNHLAIYREDKSLIK